VKKGGCLEDLNVNGKIALKWNLEKCDTVGADWVAVVEDRDWWRAIVDVVMTFRLHKMRGNIYKLCVCYYLKKDFAPRS
jgi:hypothetical protein